MICPLDCINGPWPSTVILDTEIHEKLYAPLPTHGSISVHRNLHVKVKFERCFFGGLPQMSFGVAGKKGEHKMTHKVGGFHW